MPVGALQRTRKLSAPPRQTAYSGPGLLTSVSGQNQHMRVDSHPHAASDRRTRPPARRGPALLLAASLVVCMPAFVAAGVHRRPSTPRNMPLLPPAVRRSMRKGRSPPSRACWNFAILAGVLFYFLRSPIAAHLASRSTDSQDLVTAAEMRATATHQLAQIEEKLKSLPAELDALRAQVAEDVVAERSRIARAAAVERDRLLAHTRREIDMQLRVARRALVEHAAQLAVDVAHARILDDYAGGSTATRRPLRRAVEGGAVTARGSATRYARALFDVAVAERVDPDLVHQELAAFAALVSGHESLQRALMNPAVPAARKRAVVEALFAQGGQLIQSSASCCSGSRSGIVSRCCRICRRLRPSADGTPAGGAGTAGHRRGAPGRAGGGAQGRPGAGHGRVVQIERVSIRRSSAVWCQIGSTRDDGSVTTQLQKLKQALIASAQ